MVPSFLDKTLIPHKPGVYIYKDRGGQVIYVGKAIDLYHRVSSYFSGDHDQKTTILVSEIASLDTIIVESELEALILEANLIKKYLPEFNISLKDDKDYLYIKITKENFHRVLTARKHELDKASTLKYFGPFPSSRTVRDTLKLLRRVFPWCQLGDRARGKACFYYHLGLCPGACIGEISEKDYKTNISRLSKLLEGKKQQLVEELTTEMESASGNQDFEEAARIKRILEGINYLTQSNRTQVYLENPNFLADEKQRALEKLQQILNLPTFPDRIEGYDISNIQGHESTGSMVVLTNGEIDKSQYRRFKIRITGRPNDYAMHQEMMRRRLKHKEWPLPDLFIIDGGLGQVHAVFPLIHDINSSIPVFGLAKRMEWLYSPDGSIVKLPKSHPASKLVQKLRDEAHRFAITYHRKLHRRAVIPSVARSSTLRD